MCLGYPFHPPEKPEQLRTAHLAALQTPTLICQGRRDPFGDESEVPGYPLSPAIEVRWLDGQHDHGRPPGGRRGGRVRARQHSMTLTARPPSLVSLYFVDMSMPVWRIVSTTASSDT